MTIINRRKFIENSAKATAITALAYPLLASTPTSFQFTQLPLPYAYDALEPHIDARTMEIHYTKHHMGYVKNVNEAIAIEKINLLSENDFFTKISKLSPKIRNNSGGVWNHNLFWQVMKPNDGSSPIGKIGETIQGAFGSFDKFKELFAQAAMARFGSGWVWLTHENGKLQIGSSPNQDNPLMDVSELKGTPILCLDVWEHAYYLKYQNKRTEYVSNWWNVVNWDEVARRLK